MLERQDIDALLVGALYGELSSSDQERLNTHLESHPADRNALDDLKSAQQVVRGKVASSRIFELQLDPPQAISAQLLQEAARRAPKLKPDASAKEGWFARFVHSFVAHPAMAAAATLVLVVGVAGSIYLKTGEKGIAQPTVAQESATAQREVSDQLRPSANAEKGAGSAADGIAVGLAEQENKPSPTTGAQTGGGDRGGAPSAVATTVTTPTPHMPDPAPERRKAPSADKPVIIGSSNDENLQPKDLDDSRVAKADRAEPKKKSEAPTSAPRSQAAGPGGAAGGESAGKVASNGTFAAPPPPPAPVQAPAAAPKAADSNYAWAKDQHARVLALVKAGNCQEAAPLANSIRGRDPEYYNSFVASDRALKPCMQYIQDAADREAEKRPAKARINTDTK